MRLAAALGLALAAVLYAVPAAGAAPAWQPAAEVPRIFDVDGLRNSGGHLAITLAYGAAVASPSPSPSATPTVSASPNPRPTPQSPAAFLAIIVTVAVLGAGAVAVLRARWR